MAGTTLSTIRQRDTELFALGIALAFSFAGTVLFVFAFGTIFLTVASVLFIDAEFSCVIIRRYSAAGKFGHLAHYLALGFVLAVATVMVAVTNPCIL